MELKLWCLILRLLNFLKVLIVPLWNWNKWASTWDWKSTCSNCTFMELKFIHDHKVSGSASVLIVPLWNWNKGIRYLIAFARVSSNCTFMELKWVEFLDKTRQKFSSNCTFMELKWRNKGLQRQTNRCSNCTFMELK